MSEYKQSEYYKARRKMYIAAGKCASCGGERTAADTTLNCESCRQRLNQNNRNRYKREKIRILQKGKK